MLKLEWVQLAESISFVRQAYFRDGNIHFETSFDPSLGLPATSISEQQLLKMNSWREQSLLSFYNAAVKSPYSHIANNFAGFGSILRNRNSRNALRNKDLLELMKRQFK